MTAPNPNEIFQLGNLPRTFEAYDSNGALIEIINVSSSGVFTFSDTSKAHLGISSTSTEIDQVCDVSARGVAAGSTLTVTAALHAGRVIKLDTATGSVCTLPTPTGSLNVYTFITTALATSNSHIIKVAGATDYMSGVITVGDNADGSATAFSTTGNGTTTQSDTITLNRGTTGSVKIGGDRIVLTDAAAGYWSVSGVCIGTGGEATPFSATV